MKRFCAFRGDVYYSCSGFGNYVGSFDTQDEAVVAAKSNSSHFDEWEEGDTYEWFKVYDTNTDPPTEVVSEG